MATYALSHLSDSALISGLRAVAARERGITAEFLAYLAEVDERRLYLPAGYPSMFEYCVGELHMSEDSTLKRIQAARAARAFPAIFTAVAEGRLHLSAVCMLASRLEPGIADELLAAATHKSKSEIQRLLAERFPQKDVPTRVQPIGAPAAPSLPIAPSGTVEQHAPGHVLFDDTRPQVTPLAPQRYAFQFTGDQETQELLQYAQALLGHQVAPGDIAEVFKRSLRVFVAHLEQRKFAATRKPRGSRNRASSNSRHIPADVKRTVWQRDGGQCTFIGNTSHRCPTRSRLEFDHAEPVALGGETSVANLRLRCRAHNQYAAECEFGAEFMKHKREARRESGTTRAHDYSRTAANGREGSSEGTPRDANSEVSPTSAADEEDLIRCLRALRFRSDEIKRAAAHCANMHDATLEQRVRAALSFLSPRATHRPAPAA